MDFRLRSATEAFGQGTKHRAADQRQVGQQIRVAGAGAILTHDGVSTPMVADFHSGPMSADELEPLSRAVMVWPKAGQVVAGFIAADAGLFDRAPATHDNQPSGMGEIGFERFDGEGMHGAFFNASVANSVFFKKGVF